MAQKLRVGVIFGGRSGEHEVSLVSAASIMDALDRTKYDVIPIGISRGGRWLSSAHAHTLLKLRQGTEAEPEQYLVPEPGRQGLVTAIAGGVAQRLDVVIPIVHGRYGEDGTLQGLLELADIPYVGAGVLGSAVGMDKIVQKDLFSRAGLPIVKYLWFHSSFCRDFSGRVVAAIVRSLRYPMFVKPANTGSSVGITKAHNRKELLEGLKIAGSYDRRIIVEQGVQNVREIECAVLGNDKPEASVLGEIIPSSEFYDYDAKYVDGKSQAFIPARLPRAVSSRMRVMALRAFTALDLSGMARVDFFCMKKSLRVYVNEVNSLPGFTAISMYPKLWEATGLPYQALLDQLIGLAMERHREKGKLKTAYEPKTAWFNQ